MKSYIALSILLLGVFLSCRNNLDDDNIEYAISNKTQEIILQERSQMLPNVVSQKRVKPRYATLPMKADEFLGYGYNFNSWITGDPENVGFRVLDIDKMKSNTNYIQGARPIKKAEAYIKSWGDTESFLYDSTFTKTVNSGFRLNLGLFSFGRKKKVEETFKYLGFNSKETVYGEISAEIRDVNVIMNSTSSAKQRIATTYMDDDFLFQLYNNTIDKTIEDYGLFVLTDYIAGGRASAIYYGSASKDELTITRKKDTDSSINSSFFWKSKTQISGTDTVSLSIGLIKGDHVITEEKGSVNSLYFQLHTIGGSYDYTFSTNVGKITDVTYNLNNWVRSLNEPDNCTLIEVSDKGLSPITDYLTEDNFKRRIQDTHLGILSQEELQNPYIEVVKVQIANSLFDIFAVLNTRYGDKIILNDGKVRSNSELSQNLNDNVYLSKAQAIANQKKKFYKIAIKANYATKIQPILRNPLTINLKAINESNMFKYLNTNTNIWYIYDSTNRVAFSYYNDEYIPECYGMLDWINSLPEKPISVNSLYQLYTIIGL